MSDLTGLITPRRVTPRGWALAIVIAVVVGLAWLFVVNKYSAEGGLQQRGERADAAASLLITVEPLEVDAVRNTALMHFAVTAQGRTLVDADERLLQNVRIVVDSMGGTSESKFLAGDRLGQFQATVDIDGEVANYPFDHHTGDIWISADTYTKASDGSLVSSGPVTVALQGTGGVNGWDTVMTIDPTIADTAIADFDFKRAFSTQAFALLILVTAITLSVFALIIGILTMTRRRHVEGPLLGWTAALLFALPLLRNYMPNSPPVGAAIDIYAYLWAIIAAALASVLVIIGWITQRRDELLAAEEADRAA